MKKSLELINSRLQSLQLINSRLRYEKWKVCAGVQADSENEQQGKVKLVILANNCPVLRKSDIEYYAMLAKTGVHHYSSNNTEWGTGCEKKKKKLQSMHAGYH